MRSFSKKTWLWSVAATLGLSASGWAGENPYVSQAEAIFNRDQQPLIQQINGCVADPCVTDPCVADPCCPDPCLGIGECGDGCGLFGGSCMGGELGDPWDLTDALFTDECGEGPCFDIGGWFQFGYHSNSDGVFNTYPDHFQLHQSNIYIEKIADGSEGLDWGFRADIMYGTDAQNTQSFGNPVGSFDFDPSWNHGNYGWAIPQLYGEVAYDKLSVKIGHFYTLLGYQVVPATGNFFYSIPYTFNFSEAFTHTGALATYAASDEVTLYGGWTLGWDTGFDQLNQGNSFLGGSSIAVTDNLKATYILTAGNLGWIGEGYSQSWVLDWTINDKFEYVFQSDWLEVDSAPGINSPITGTANTHYDTIGVNQYLFYTMTDRLKAGARVEWWKADGNSLYEMAYGLNIKPHANVIIRPEVRYNWSPAAAIAGTPYDDTTIFGIDAIVTF